MVIFAAFLTFIFSIGSPLMQEDDPRWDCRIHGNMICGPGADHPEGNYANPEGK